MRRFLSRYWYLSAGVTGIISGVAVGIEELPGSNISQALHVVPYIFNAGTIFGIITSVYFLFIFEPKPAIGKLIIWIFASAASFILAVASNLYLGKLIKYSVSFHEAGIIAMGVAGFVGVSVLIVAFHYLFLRLRFYSIIVLLLAGALIPIMANNYPDFAPFALFISWQTLVMLVLAHRIHSSQIQ